MTLPESGCLQLRYSIFPAGGRIWNRVVALYELLIFSSLLLALECIAMAYVSCAIQQLPWDPVLAAIPFLVAFSVYNLNRKTDEDEDAVNRQDRFAFTKRYEGALYNGALVSLLFSLVLSAGYGAPALLATAAPFVIGILYSFRLLPACSGYRRLKEIPAVKNIAVGVAWGVLLSLLPVFFWHRQPDAATAITFLLFFLWGFMASLIPDMRDRGGDAGAGVRTIPVIFGEERAARILTGVILLLGIPLIASGIRFLPLNATGILIASLLYSHMCVFLARKEGMIHVVADLISDGQYIFFALALSLPGLLHP